MITGAIPVIAVTDSTRSEDYYCLPLPQNQRTKIGHRMKVISFFLPLIVAAICAGCSITSSRSDTSGGTTTQAGSDDTFALALKEWMPALLASNKVPGAVVSCIKN